MRESCTPGPGASSGAVTKGVSASNGMGSIVGIGPVAEARGLRQHTGDRAESSVVETSGLEQEEEEGKSPKLGSLCVQIFSLSRPLNGSGIWGFKGHRRIENVESFSLGDEDFVGLPANDRGRFHLSKPGVSASPRPGFPPSQEGRSRGQGRQRDRVSSTLCLDPRCTEPTSFRFFFLFRGVRTVPTRMGASRDRDSYPTQPLLIRGSPSHGVWSPRSRVEALNSRNGNPRALDHAAVSHGAPCRAARGVVSPSGVSVRRVRPPCPAVTS